MDVCIREARTTDYADLCAIYAELDALHRTEHPELFVQAAGPARTKEYIEELIGGDARGLFVAQLGTRVVGFAECYIAHSTAFPVLRSRRWVQLDNIAVLQAYRKKRVASMLFERVKEWAREKGLARIELKVYDFNEAAIAFYNAGGFATLSRSMFLDL